MKMPRKFYVAMSLSWLAIVPAAKAQFICNVTLPAQYETLENYFLAFSCNGNYCTAAEMENADTGAYPDTRWATRIIFQHSTDGGQTWERQDPFSPLLSDDYRYVNSIDQIDSLHEIAVGDSGLIFQTSDGGQTWSKQYIGQGIRTLLKVSFANPSEGMIIGYNTTINSDIVFYTVDSGSNWSATRLTDTMSDCRAYGNGKFRVFESIFGKVYTTYNYFQSIDSTKALFDSLTPVNGHAKALEKCQFGLGDSMIAYGADWIGSNPNSLIWRSTNGGVTWRELLDTDEDTRGINTMTGIDRDTVLAGFGAGDHKILISFDHGAHWKFDTLLFNTVYDSVVYITGCRGIGLTPEGSLVGVFGPVTSSLIFGQMASAGVSSDVWAPVNLVRIYPNPATNSVKLVSELTNSTVHLLDVLGREVDRATISSRGTLTLDVSRLPRGMYIAMIETNGIMLPAGKIVLTGE